MAIFFVFSMLLGAALQITNAFGKPFLDDFGSNDAFKGTFAVEHPNILISISQISETLFILSIPFFLRRFGIKRVMLLSIIAWFFRFALFGIGDPGSGLIFLVLSMIIYGMAFDFFNISGSLFVETTTDHTIRSSAQGLFMMMTNGFGAIIGSYGSGYLIDSFFTHNGVKDWHNIWLSFAAYALVIAILFALMFSHKHDPNAVENVSH